MSDDKKSRMKGFSIHITDYQIRNVLKVYGIRLKNKLQGNENGHEPFNIFIPRDEHLKNLIGRVMASVHRRLSDLDEKNFGKKRRKREPQDDKTMTNLNQIDFEYNLMNEKKQKTKRVLSLNFNLLNGTEQERRSELISDIPDTEFSRKK